MRIREISYRPSDYRPVSTLVTERFITSLAHLLKRGSSVSDAVECSIFCVPESIRATVIRKLAETGDGEEIANALVEAFPALVPYSALISQSLVSGELADTLNKIASRLSYEREVRGQMRSACIYPIILCLIAIIAVLSMLVFIVPQVQKSLLTTKIQVGILSRGVFGMSNILVSHPIFCTVISLGFIYAFIIYWSRIRGFVQKVFFSKSLLYKLMSDYELSLFWSYVSLAYVSSRDLETSLFDGAGSIRNVKVRMYFEKLSKCVVGDMVHSMGDVYISEKIKPFISKDVIDYWKASIMIQTRSGSLDLVFAELADSHRQRTEEKIKVISKLSEPIAMMIIGGMIGLISIAMLSPFYEMTQAVSSL